jgi:hypothetical protein
MVKPINWGGMLEPYLQPLKERLGMLPLGQYEDGSVRMAWPGMLADTFAKGQAASETPIPPVNDDAAWADKSAAMFDMTSLAPMAGAGVAMTGALDNALGSAGGNLAKGAADLPMDLASRMARAREMGFDTERTLYHGTDATFDAFDLDKFGKTDWGFRGRGVYMTPDSELAGRYGPNVGEYYVRGRVGSSDDAQVAAIRSAAWKEAGEQGKAQGLSEYALDEFRKERMNQSMREAGYSSYFDETGQEVLVFDPRNIRSVNAAFDPARSDSANLLAANAKTGSIPGLLANALEQPQGIRAYHGSPHDFDKFDISKIGTGEGAQAYGHGLYLAESEDVARSYRDNLAKPINPLSDDEVAGIRSALDSLKFNNPNIAANSDARDALDFTKESLTDFLGREPTREELVGELTKKLGKGYMYEVNIRANPQDFLDWDKPLSQQSEAVRSVVNSLIESARKSYPSLDPENMTGQAAVRAYAGHRGNNYDTVSEVMREQGIPGIKYLDGMSRGAGEGSSNYVVFDDALIDILRKYANAPTASAIPAGMEAAQSDDPQTLTTANILRLLMGGN